MKRTQHAICALFTSALIITLSACSGGGGGGSTSQTPPPPPYPDPNNPSEFPVMIDTQEGDSGNNTSSTAGSLTIGNTSYHTIYPVGDEDWLAVTLEAGTRYEFSVDNVSYNGLPFITLYKSDGTTKVTYAAGDDEFSAWGYLSLDPRVTFTPDVSGTYYVRVHDYGGGISSYTLSSRIFSDSDSDTYSPHYDCDDTDASIYAWATETADDTIDQSCSGYDWPVDTADDAYEGDNDFSTAGTLPILKGDPWDIIHRGEVYAETHTITSGDIDTYKITVPAYTFYEIFEIESTGANLDTDIYLSTATNPGDEVSVTDGGTFINHWLNNTLSSTPTDYYLKVYATPLSGNPPGSATGTAAYVLGVGDGGSDADGDGYFTRSQGSGWDCDDNDATINAGAAEAAPNDGIDSNCNGKDDT